MRCYKNPELIRIARRQSLRALTELTKETQSEPDVFYTSTDICKNAGKGRYGVIDTKDVPVLLEKYISAGGTDGMVLRIRVRKHTTGSGEFYCIYRANLDCMDEIERELGEL